MLLGNPGQATSPGAETNASCFHILFVAGLWVGEGNARPFPWGPCVSALGGGTTWRCVLRKSSQVGSVLIRWMCPRCVPLASQEKEVGAPGLWERHHGENQRPLGPLSLGTSGQEGKRQNSRRGFQKGNGLLPGSRARH